MPGITSLLDIGKKSLFANQTSIEVVGNNISNANTEGYSRQAVRLEDGLYINYAPGQLGTGVNAAEVIRYFDEFIEAQYNAKSSDQQRWEKLYENLQGVEAILNESNSKGINSALTEFWEDWQDLSADPQNVSIRTALLGHASNLERAIQTAEENLLDLQGQIDGIVDDEVNEINTLLTDIAELNTKIAMTEETGKNNANGLRDERSALVRKLAERMDIRYIDNGLGNVTITTQAGHTLVDGYDAFRLSFEGPQAIPDLESTYSGALRFEGTSSYEYTVDVLGSGEMQTGSVAAPATFRVSIDGGKSWLADAEGNVLTFTAGDYDHRVLLPDGTVSIFFEAGAGSNVIGADDSFQVLPKGSLFWHQTTSSKINITPQVLPNGGDNERRLTGGSLVGYLQFRDNAVGEYLEKLDAFSASLAWEVNRVHSQGAGLEHMTSASGTYRVTNGGVPLGEPESGLIFGDRLESGNVAVYTYSTSSGALVGSQTLDFGGGANFDPEVHSLEDVRAAFDALDGVTATILDGSLQLQADAGYDFAFGSDSCGLLAAVGINTFFEGSDSRTLALNSLVRENIAFINSGHVNGAGETNEGDNTTASALTALRHTDVRVRTISGGVSSQTLSEYYSTLVSKAGADTSAAKFNFEYQAALASDLKARQEAVSGVNLDEEMTNLIKFQHAYTAAAKLITTADSMLEVLLGLKS